MKEQFIKAYTDLAVELTEGLKRPKEEFQETEVEDGICIEVKKKGYLKKTRIKIMNDAGAERLGKPIGTYITLEGENLSDIDESYHRDISLFLEETLADLLSRYHHIFIVGLGNECMTADSLGPKVVRNLAVTRHLICNHIISEEGHKITSANIPGVMAQTGMEASEIVKGIADVINPDAIIVVDALAARNTERLNKTIQICDTGISPGSGIGNHRKAINKETIGRTVFAIGVPTVIPAHTLIRDILCTDTEHSKQKMIDSTGLKYADLFVTPKDIDDAIKKISYTISEAINGICY